MRNDRGHLILVVGPSGAGKDALLREARKRFATEPRLEFAERIVTRPNRAGHVTHVEMDSLDFELARDAGRFGLFWFAHGNRYGVPIEAFAPLADGRCVVINASRTVIESARELYSPVRVICVTASVPTRKQRIERRGREDGVAIDKRLTRIPDYRPQGDDVVELVNEGSLTDCAERFSELLAQTLSSS